MGPHGGLSLRGGTGCPAPHWNLEPGTNSKNDLTDLVYAKMNM